MQSCPSSTNYIFDLHQPPSCKTEKDALNDSLTVLTADDSWATSGPDDSWVTYTEDEDNMEDARLEEEEDNKEKYFYSRYNRQLHNIPEHSEYLSQGSLEEIDLLDLEEERTFGFPFCGHYYYCDEEHVPQSCVNTAMKRLARFSNCLFRFETFSASALTIDEEISVLTDNVFVVVSPEAGP